MPRKEKDFSSLLLEIKWGGRDVRKRSKPTSSLRSNPDAFAKGQSHLVKLETLAEVQKTLSTTLEPGGQPIAVNK